MKYITTNHPEQRTLNLYQELRAVGYVQNCQQSIITLLNDLNRHSTNEVAAVGGKQYNARILELRRMGWNIVSEREGKDRFYFRLVHQGRRW